MFGRFRRAAAFLLLASSPAAAAGADLAIAPAELARHIEVLAGDDFLGREPGTQGETLTIAYIASQLQARGLEPAGPEGSWYQPLVAVERRRSGHRVRWTTARGRALRFENSSIVLLGREAHHRIDDARLVFVGHGMVDRERGIDQLAGADLRGAVALMLVEGPAVPGFPSFEERRRAVAEAGPAAVIGIVSDEVPWTTLAEASERGEHSLDIDMRADVQGEMAAGEIARLVRAAGGDFGRLLNDQPGSSFRAVRLGLRVSMDVTSEVRRITTHNVIGRIRGTGGGGESVLLLGHWDHFGLCGPEGAEDRICNGAVDNASGIATLIEAAGRLALGARPERDILVLATTVEERGLLGARYFVDRPTVPIGSIAAAVNVDTVAIHGKGEPVAVIGRGIMELDRAIEATAEALGRTMDRTHAADAFVQRQDGWALARKGVPAVMVGGSFANMGLLQAFLAGDYHSPEDELRTDTPLEGAAEDADLLVALARRLATPALYRRPEAGAARGIAAPDLLDQGGRLGG
ncbi:M28 family peptidase [Allosphingosinicella sp.]|jgi:hypothetical protein|uniref:M28 family peptidase n=1 Tax=Allosphingosinicella sp. TaxID=2823234 RepID=UPI002F112D6C